MKKPIGQAAAMVAMSLVLSAPAFAEIDNEELRELALALFEPIPEGPIAIDDEELTQEQIELGKMLFFETRLSRGHNISCNTCHNLGTGGAGLARPSLAAGRAEFADRAERRLQHRAVLGWARGGSGRTGRRAAGQPGRDGLDRAACAGNPSEHAGLSALFRGRLPG